MNKKCPDCKNKLLTASRTIDEFDVDEEPYESGLKEEGKIMRGSFCTTEDVTIIIMYCEKCDKIITTYVEE